MKILLTGPFGNVGSHVIPELLREGHQVRAFDLDGPATRKVAKELAAEWRSLASVIGKLIG